MVNKSTKLRAQKKQDDEKKKSEEKNSGIKMQLKEDGKDMVELKLTTDLGSLSPILDEFFSSPNQFSLTLSPTSPTQFDIVKDSVGPIMISDQERRKTKEAEKKEEAIPFKQQLVAWLKNKNLKLAPIMNVENVNINMNANNEMNIDQIKKFSFQLSP